MLERDRYTENKAGFKIWGFKIAAMSSIKHVLQSSKGACIVGSSEQALNNTANLHQFRQNFRQSLLVMAI